MEKIEKGTIIEVKVPNVENPIKAVVLDIIVSGESEGDFSVTAYYTYILYAQKRLFKASNECQRGINTSFTEDGEPIDEMFENWSDFTYNGIIIDYCEIPAIPSDILI